MALFRSPAKLNLFLSVIGKRIDGYHELASLFQAVDLFDTLSFEFSDEDRFTCSDPFLPLDHSNLVLKALALFRAKTALHFPVKIHLDKWIPSEAGLGGGSSNAATTLFALNAMSDAQYSESELQDWSAEIGADIPFFFSNGTAYCTGKGEIVRNLPSPPLGEFTISKPKFGLSTPKVFKCLDLRMLKTRDLDICLQNFYSGTPQFFNDLEPAALLAEPKLVSFKQSISGTSEAHMTGSGSAFFCSGKDNLIVDGFSCKVNLINRIQGNWY